MNKIVYLLLLCINILIVADVTTIQNDFVKIVVSPDGFDQGRFSIETTGGDPSRQSDDNSPLIYGRPKPWTSFTTIAVDDTFYGFGTQTIKRAGKKAIYGQVVDHSKTDTMVVHTSQLKDVEVKQQLSFFRNPLSNVEDAVLIEYILTNQSQVTRNIGLRIMMDTMLGKNDAAPFRIGNDSIESEQQLIGDDILDYWQTFDSLVKPNVIGQGLLRHPPAGLTPPDKLILMNWGSLADNVFDVKLIEEVNSNPENMELRFKLANSYLSNNETEKGFSELLKLFEQNPTWNEEAAKKKLLEFFDLLGFNDPNVLEARKRLSSLMFK